MDLTVFEYLAQQITDNSDDEAVYKYMNVFLENDLTEDETKKVSEILKEVFERIGKPKITDIRQNIALYQQECIPSMKKFYRWLDTRLNKLANEEITKNEFLDMWNNAYGGILKKMNNPKTDFIDRHKIRNLIEWVTEI